MKKEYYLLFMLILLEIFAITTQSSACGSLNPTKADDCKDDTLIQSQKDADFVHCCYKQYEKKSDNNECVPLTSKQYNNIGKLIKYFEESDSYKYEIKIDCHSSNLHLFLFVLIMQLILL
jgi:hypothetical protein